MEVLLTICIVIIALACLPKALFVLRDYGIFILAFLVGAAGIGAVLLLWLGDVPAEGRRWLIGIAFGGGLVDLTILGASFDWFDDWLDLRHNPRLDRILGTTV